MKLLSAPWPTRIAWAALPLTLGPALGGALDGSTRAVSLTGAALAWGVWAVVLVAVIIPRTASLTALRIAAPAALATANWAALTGSRGAADAVGVAWAAVTLVTAFSPITGDAFVNGSSYGDERRMPLRVPGALLLGPIPLTWAAAATPLVIPLLVAAHQWIAAVAAAVIGGPAAVVAIRALHGLSRRWVVFVPAGLVLHDLHAMVDPVLFPRASIRRLGPAPADGDEALDLTQRAFGLALELELVEPTEVAPRRRDGRVEVVPVQRLLFTPTRPGALLVEAARRRIAVAAPSPDRPQAT